MQQAQKAYKERSRLIRRLSGVSGESKERLDILTTPELKKCFDNADEKYKAETDRISNVQLMVACPAVVAAWVCSSSDKYIGVTMAALLLIGATYAIPPFVRTMLFRQDGLIKNEVKNALAAHPQPAAA